MSESPQLVRQWKILQILEASRNGCMVQKLIAETEVSDKTVHSDLKVLQNVFDITERTLDGGIKRWQMKPLSEQLGFNYTELLSIHMSQQFLKPLGMVHHKGSLYLIAWSARREEVRNFKVDRMESVAMQNLQYQVPIEFDLQEWLSKSFGANRKKQVEDHAEKRGLRNVVIILRVMCCSKRQIWCRANFQVDEIKWTASVTRRVTTTLVCPVHGTDAVLKLVRQRSWGRRFSASERLSEYSAVFLSHAYTKLGQIDTLKDRHGDVPLIQIDYDSIEQMYRFWRQRPLKRARSGDQEQRMSRSSVRHYVGELHRFFKWLHRSKDFLWQKPDDLDEIDRSIPLDTDSVKRRIRRVDTFQLEELRLLNRYATPIERLYLMLGLNCGFGAKEIATLTIGEIFLHQALPADEQEVFGFSSTDNDSFVLLVRNKTTIVGKYLLFKQTESMLEWMMARRLKQRNPAPDQPAILNSRGLPLDRRSNNGNPSRQIPNAFTRLHQRITNDGNEITDLPFKHLRKTAGDLIRRFSDGEVAGIFLLHGNPVTSDKLSDVYTNRPFGKVYEAIRRVEEYLQPVFQETGDAPTLEKPQAYTSRKAIDRIAELKSEGKSVREIAEAVGKSRTTVHRHIQKLQDQGLMDGQH